MSNSTDRMTHAPPPDKSPAAVAPDKQQLRQRLLELILKREAERRAPPRAAG